MNNLMKSHLVPSKTRKVMRFPVGIRPILPTRRPKEKDKYLFKPSFITYATVTLGYGITIQVTKHALATFSVLEFERLTR